MIDRDHKTLSVRRQCELLQLSRSGLYYQPVPTSEEELALMRRIDELHLERPFYGSRKISLVLRTECEASRGVVNRKRVQRLMRLMGLEAMVPKPKTSEPHPEHPVYPYLLRGLSIVRANHVWAADITYIPMKIGFLYLVAIIDWYSRFILAWRLSNTLDSSFCVQALEDALERFGQPTIFNTDQGAQFTADAFTKPLRDRGIAISMDGKGRCIDNIFVERVWRSLKYEEVYLHAYDDGAEAKGGIGRYFNFYNDRRPHQALGYQTPAAFYRDSMARNGGATDLSTVVHSPVPKLPVSPQTPLAKPRLEVGSPHAV
jgi:putative transposase